MHNPYRTHLTRQCNTRGLQLTADQLDGLCGYVDYLLHWRRRINLTGLRDPQRMVDVLVVESLDFLRRDMMPPGARILDLGTGAGVPGIPLAICAPDVHLTLLDRSEKKIAFLRHIIPRLQLSNCRPLCDTAETLATQVAGGSAFDVVVSRGVGEVTTLLRLAAPLLRTGGRLLLRKSRHSADLEVAETHLATTGWSALRTHAVASTAAADWVLLEALRDAA